MISPEVARMAAEWWGDRLLGRLSGWDQFREAGYFRGSDETAMGGVFGGFLVDKILEKSGPITEEVAAHYVDNLTAGIMAEAEKQARYRDGGMSWITPSVDYHPCKLLADAAEGLEIKNLDMRLPWKTSMHITENYVEVKGDVLYQTKADAIRRLVEAKAHAWEDEGRAPPRFEVFGDSGPGKHDAYYHSAGKARDEVGEQLYWADSQVVRRRFIEVLKEIPDRVVGDVDDLATAIVAGAVARAPSVLGVVVGAKFRDASGWFEIASVGNVPDAALLEHPEWRSIYGECVVSKGEDRSTCTKVEDFVDWVVRSGTEIARP